MAKHSVHDVLAHFREAASSNRDLGDRFERLICRYLELDPIYAERFSRVWMWNEWPRKGNVGDVGIDVVAEDRATGVTLSGEDESLFVKVHDANFIKAKKRLYMTAAPRVYGDEALKPALRFNRLARVSVAGDFAMG